MLDLSQEVLGDVLVAAPGCPDMVAERVLARATRQFCMDTHAWRHTTPDVPVFKGHREIWLDVPRDTTIQRLFWVTLGGVPLTGVSERALLETDGSPEGYVLGAEGHLFLDRIPAQSVTMPGLKAHLALAPIRGRANLPDELEPFLDSVVQLATAHLLAMPSVEWRDPRGAQDAMALYHQQSIHARRHGQQRGQSIHRKVRYGGL